MAFHAKVPGFQGAFVGVDVFFVLSGYLITGILLRQIDTRGKVQYRDFYIRRFFRLVPALLALLAIYLLVAPYLWPGRSHGLEATLAVLYVADYSRAFMGLPTVLSHTWSLAVEEHFYIIWPPLLALMASRYRGTRLLIVLAALWLASTAWRMAWISHGQTWGEVYYRFDTRASGLVLGSLLAAAMARGWGPELHRVRAWIYCIPIIAIAMAHQPWGQMSALRHVVPAVELATGAIILAVAFKESWITTVLSARILVWLGMISYGLYLWHYPIFVWMRSLYAWPYTFVVGGALTTALAWASWITVERAAFHIRDRLSIRSGNRVEVTRRSEVGDFSGDPRRG